LNRHVNADSYHPAADESLKFWKVFEKKAGSASVSSGSSTSTTKATLTKATTIR